MNAATFLVGLIPLSLFLVYWQCLVWERKDLRRQIDADYVARQRRALEGR